MTPAYHKCGVCFLNFYDSSSWSAIFDEEKLKITCNSIAIEK